MEGLYYDPKKGKLSNLYRRKAETSRGLHTAKVVRAAIKGITQMAEDRKVSRDVEGLIEDMTKDIFRSATDW
eukprot:8539973-Lingulodinium_polyedra.AAC.1